MWPSRIWTRSHYSLQTSLTHYVSVWMPLFWSVVKPNMDMKSWCLTAKSDLPCANLDFIVLRCGEAEFVHEVMTLYNQVCPHHLSDCIPLFWGMVGQNKNKRSRYFTAKSVFVFLSCLVCIDSSSLASKHKGFAFLWTIKLWLFHICCLYVYKMPFDLQVTS